MSVLFIGKGEGIDSAVLDPHVTGDLLILHASNRSAGVPAIQAGWTQLDTTVAGLCDSITAYKVATSNSEVTGTWTNATSLIVDIYRSGGTLEIGAHSLTYYASNSIMTWAELLLDVTDGSSAVMAISTHRSANANPNNSPNLSVLRSSYENSFTSITSGYDLLGTTVWGATTTDTETAANSYVTGAIEIKEIPPSVVITNITDPLNTNAQSTINGTGFEAVQGTGKVEQIQGAKSTILVIDTWGELQVLADSLNIESTLYKYGTHDLKVTADGGDSATTAFDSIPAINNDYVNITSLATAGDRLTGVPDLAVNDQVRYQSFLHSNGSPTIYSVVVNPDSTFSVSGSTPGGTYAFEVKVWDSSDETWGSAANQTVVIGGGIPVASGGKTRNGLLIDIIVANGGTITKPSNRNSLLKDWLTSIGG
jgi:hypothetical protein